jgi:hypothetical protein
MTPRLLKPFLWASGGGVAAMISAIVRPGDRLLVLDVYLLFVGGLALLLLTRATTTAVPRAEGRSRIEQALRPLRRREARPTALASLERKVLLSTETAFEVHYRLRPILREIATYRLSSRRGIELDHDVEAARAVLGPEAWELVRPDREPPPDRLGRGHPLADLRAAVEALERI